MVWRPDVVRGCIVPTPPVGHHETPPRPMSDDRYEERTAWVYDEREFPVWNQSFDKADRAEMIRDDLWAGRSIAVLLATLVAIGLILALVTLSFVANWR
jgi:hypothetical protein